MPPQIISIKPPLSGSFLQNSLSVSLSPDSVSESIEKSVEQTTLIPDGVGSQKIWWNALAKSCHRTLIHQSTSIEELSSPRKEDLSHTTNELSAGLTPTPFSPHCTHSHSGSFSLDPFATPLASSRFQVKKNFNNSIPCSTHLSRVSVKSEVLLSEMRRYPSPVQTSRSTTILEPHRANSLPRVGGPRDRNGTIRSFATSIAPPAPSSTTWSAFTTPRPHRLTNPIPSFSDWGSPLVTSTTTSLFPSKTPVHLPSPPVTSKKVFSAKVMPSVHSSSYTDRHSSTSILEKKVTKLLDIAVVKNQDSDSYLKYREMRPIMKERNSAISEEISYNNTRRRLGLSRHPGHLNYENSSHDHFSSDSSLPHRNSSGYFPSCTVRLFHSNSESTSSVSMEKEMTISLSSQTRSTSPSPSPP